MGHDTLIELSSSSAYLRRLRYREKNRERLKAEKKKWYEKNRDSIREKRRAYNLRNRESRRAKQKLWEVANRERLRLRKAERTYGHMPGYKRAAEFLTSGAVRCECCGSADPGSKNGWHIDHDHVRHIVRGVLCRGCNCALGNVKESSNTLEALIHYLATRSGDATHPLS